MRDADAIAWPRNKEDGAGIIFNVFDLVISSQLFYSDGGVALTPGINDGILPPPLSIAGLVALPTNNNSVFDGLPFYAVDSSKPWSLHVKMFLEDHYLKMRTTTDRNAKVTNDN